MSQNLNDWLAAQRRICEAADKGPWFGMFAGDRTTGKLDIAAEDEHAAFFVCDVHPSPNAEANREFLCTARTALPAALEMVEVLRDALLSRRCLCRTVATDGSYTCKSCDALRRCEELAKAGPQNHGG